MLEVMMLQLREIKGEGKGSNANKELPNMKIAIR
jgi:hypothetical protein